MPSFAPAYLAMLATSVALAPALDSHAVELRGFRGLQWGDAADKLGAQARFVRTDGGLRCYTRPNENLLFGDAALNNVQYCFGPSGLTRIWLDAAAPWAALRAEFEQGYGRAARVDADRAYWPPTPGGVEVEVQAGESRAASRLRMEWRP
jgi:hypothetical protein